AAVVELALQSLKWDITKPADHNLLSVCTIGTAFFRRRTPRTAKWFQSAFRVFAIAVVAALLSSRAIQACVANLLALPKGPLGYAAAVVVFVAIALIIASVRLYIRAAQQKKKEKIITKEDRARFLSIYHPSDEVIAVLSSIEEADLRPLTQEAWSARAR